jgi:hypothetical protein
MQAQSAAACPIPGLRAILEAWGVDPGNRLTYFKDEVASLKYMTRVRNGRELPGGPFGGWPARGFVEF